MYYIYMLRCKDNSIYTGITTDVLRRYNEHLQKGKKCAKYTLNHEVEKIEAVWKTQNRIYASRLEYNIKRLNKSQKEQLILNHNFSDLFNGKIDENLYEYCEKFS